MASKVRPQPNSTDTPENILSDSEIESDHAVEEDSQLVIEDVQLGHVGNYSCSVRNIHGSDFIIYNLHVLCKIIIFICKVCFIICFMFQ